MITAVFQRIEDLTRERRIKQHAANLRLAMGCGDKSAARSHSEAMRDECMARSPTQVQRMEFRARSRSEVPHA